MPTKGPSKRALLSEYLERNRPARIAEAQRREIEEFLAPVSESYLRGLLRGAGVPLDPLVEGVRQDSTESLERTLLALGALYSDARLAGDRVRQEETRRHVRTAKDHARLWLRRPGVSPEARAAPMSGTSGESCLQVVSPRTSGASVDGPPDEVDSGNRVAPSSAGPGSLVPQAGHLVAESGAVNRQELQIIARPSRTRNDPCVG